MSPRPTAWARPVLTGVVLAAAVLSALAGLVTGRALPAAAQASAPAVTRETLPNGLIAMVRENPTAPVVAMSVMVRMGTLVETPATAGISNLLQLMLVRGTPRALGRRS